MDTKITKFEQLRVWQISHELTINIYLLTKRFPKDELYGIVSQIRRAASSVPANIVEGFYRDTTKELVKFLFNARGSAGEVGYFLILSKDLGYISEKEFMNLKDSYESLLKQISAFINSLNKK
ncbi:MAG: Ribosomal protein S23 [Candidatus Woesebacteria bacterium GW2011_GWB1_38_8]|uniref:Ribosomal protein S23 n=1 Tax=Candidatus Woesebacteria bacterium GW2011_GWB1_38_8 TaxID=1618570 RepID=A0A0G0NDA7_9BACT|nr:MAG: Ribosomal protein S23 [Candidatus Woesebacteria bacterium GW2011_GWB1_38_8]